MGTQAYRFIVEIFSMYNNNDDSNSFLFDRIHKNCESKRVSNEIKSVNKTENKNLILSHYHSYRQWTRHPKYSNCFASQKCFYLKRRMNALKIDNWKICAAVQQFVTANCSRETRVIPIYPMIVRVHNNKN